MPAPLPTAGLADIVALTIAQADHLPTDCVVVAMLRPSPVAGAVVSTGAIHVPLPHGDDMLTSQIIDALLRRVAAERSVAAMVITFSDSVSQAAPVRSQCAEALAHDLGSEVYEWHVDGQGAVCVGPCPAGPCRVTLEDLRAVADFLTGPSRVEGAARSLEAGLGDEASSVATAAGEAWALEHPGPFGDVDPAAARELWREAVAGLPDSRPINDAQYGRLVRSLHTPLGVQEAFVEVVGAVGGRDLRADPARDAYQWSVTAMLSVEPGDVLEPGPLALAAVDLLCAVASRGAGRARAGALSLAAALAWWNGRTHQGCTLVEEALDADGTCLLALLVNRTVRTGAPGWARRRTEHPPQ